MIYPAPAMFVPMPVLALVAIAFLVLAMLALRAMRPRDGDEMIACQRRDCGAGRGAPPARDEVPASTASRKRLAPRALPSDEEALLAIPEVRGAIEHGRKSAAIRHLRENAGLDARESRRLVERYAARR